MSTYDSTSQKYSPSSTSSGPRHSKDDRLTDREYELLLEGAAELDPYHRLTAKFAIVAGGRLGMRAGEIAHLQAEWVDWRQRMIEVPRHQPCDGGKDGGPCGYCRQLAGEMASRDPDRSEAEVQRRFWQPKTEAAARRIPFDFDARVELMCERFFDEHDQWPYSRQAVNRRVTRAASAADELEADDVYPHALRATAASHHAGRGLRALPLQAFMGWADLSTAQAYVRISGEATRSALKQAHQQ